MPWPSSGRTQFRDLENQMWPPWALISRQCAEISYSGEVVTTTALCWQMSAVGLACLKVLILTPLGLVTQGLLICRIPKEVSAVRTYSRGHWSETGAVYVSHTRKHTEWGLISPFRSKYPLQVWPFILKPSSWSSSARGSAPSVGLCRIRLYLSRVGIPHWFWRSSEYTVTCESGALKDVVCHLQVSRANKLGSSAFLD